MQEADLMIGLSKMQERALVMDFSSLPFFVEYRAFVYKKPDQTSSLFGLISNPFR
jgi:hypothetical protein